MQPQLEYILAMQVWNPHLIKDFKMFEAIYIQKHAAIGGYMLNGTCSDNFTWSKTTEAHLQEFCWPWLVVLYLCYICICVFML